MVYVTNRMVSNNEEAQLSYLLSGACDVVPPSYIKLRSYLNIHLSNVADQQNLNLPKHFRNRNKTCPYCYTNWCSDTSSFKLLPSKKKSKRRKTQNEKKKGDQLTESRNTLILKCKVCTNKSLFSLVKKKPIKEVVKEETVQLGKKKKKKKDKACGLRVNLIKEDQSLSEVSKKKKRSENSKQSNNNVSTSKHSQSNFSQSPKIVMTLNDKKLNPLNGKNKKLVCNPFASQSQNKFSKNKIRKLQNLKKAIKGEKGLNSAKKTLKDFLTLI